MIFVDEQEYYNKDWENQKKLVYTSEYNELIKSFPKWNGEEVDIVYSITYPYNVSNVKINNKPIPKCVFYTSEFAWLDQNYFCVNKQTFLNSNELIKYIGNSRDLYFTSPSVWSSQGLKMLGVPDKRNRIITHGVDTSLFKLDQTKTTRKEIRDFFKFSDEDIVLVNIGAMTQNKGIILILEALHTLVNQMGHKEFKLLLKGTSDLYNSRMFLESYIDNMIKSNIMSESDSINLLNNHIVFLDKTFTYKRINDIFNGCDLYISPYLAEGFNLTVLESLASGLPVLVPETGSTYEYINEIQQNGGHPFIYKVPSKIAMHNNGMKQNVINVKDLINTLVTNKHSIITMKDFRYTESEKMHSYLNTYYSWKTVASMLYEYLEFIVKESK
jgi:glycosyltransferase involved in cell wall biosynthesis